MRKNLLKAFSLLLSTVFIFIALYIPVSAISEDIVTDHFSKLNENDFQTEATPPSMSSCPYVAMSLLLTFYDSYWNERFVADELEWELGSYDSLTDAVENTFAATEEAEHWDQYLAG